MSLLSGVSDYFGLDIGSDAIRIVQLSGSGPVKSLMNYGYIPIDIKTAQSDSAADQQKLLDAVSELISQARVSTRNVIVGLNSQRVFTTVVDMDRLDPGELAKTIKYQADSLIPTPPAESTIDWALLGDSPVNKAKVEVLLTSVPNDFVERRLDMLESIGLNVIAFEPSSFALARSILASDAALPQMVVNVGVFDTTIVVSVNGAPRLTRSIPTGTDAFVKAAMQNLNIDEKQANQFVFKFGLAKDKLEGQVYQAISGTVETLMSEIDKSIKFFQNRYTEAMKIDRVIVTGGASSLPEFPLYIANKFGMNVEIGNAWRNISFSADRQNELLAVSNHFAVAAGLAQRDE